MGSLREENPFALDARIVAKGKGFILPQFPSKKGSIMRVVYMGTPFFAATVLERLLTYEDIEVVGVYAQPDRQAGRGKKFQEPETKIVANKHGIPVFQPLTLRNNPIAVKELASLSPDLLVVAAYGMLLPAEVLEIPKYGAYNVHASLLPQYRGAAPVQRGLIAGDRVTGISIMRMELGLDTGAILLQQAVAIQDTENFSHTSGSLLEALADMGAALMVSAIKMISEARVFLVEQNHELATYAPKLTKTEAIIDWSKSAEDIHHHVRGFTPNPGATSTLQLKEMVPVRIEKGFPLDRTDFNSEDFFAASCQTGQTAKNSDVLNNHISDDHASKNCEGQIGQLLGIYKEYLVVRCGVGYYGISQIRLAGKPSIDAKSFYNGYMRTNTDLLLR